MVEKKHGKQKYKEGKIFQKKINKSINEMTELYFLATYKSMFFNIKLIHEDLQRFQFRAKTYTKNEFNLNIQKKTKSNTDN